MPGLGGQGGAEQARAGDGVQRPLRFRYPPRLTRSVRQTMVSGRLDKDNQL
jgi:hypothetical protein